ncbi:MAG: hypothetical protein JNL32_08945 [Candidatus Kapabacteria bacterium]|nr:hypothetical protein [Candidatus Kapabacteria bacterium]
MQYRPLNTLPTALSLLLFFFSATLLTAQERSAASLRLYALHLLETEDYFRAVSALKEYRFFHPSDTSALFSSYYSAYAYLRSGKYQLGLDEATGIAPEIVQRYPHVHHNLTIIQSLCYSGMKLSSYALNELAPLNRELDTNGNAAICKALYYAETKRYTTADSVLQMVQHSATLQSNRDIARQMRSTLAKVDSLPVKSPAFAGILSAIVPGLGQIYTQHYFDGVQAFAFVGTFAYATYATYTYETVTNKPRIGSTLFLIVASAFHLSNILGAARTAEFRNSRGIESLMLDIRSQALSINLMVRI